MNQQKAKAIRKYVYRKNDRTNTEYRRLNNGQIICTGLYRSVYQDMKRECKNMSLSEIKKYLSMSDKYPTN